MLCKHPGIIEKSQHNEKIAEIILLRRAEGGAEGWYNNNNSNSSSSNGERKKANISFIPSQLFSYLTNYSEPGMLIKGDVSPVVI